MEKVQFDDNVIVELALKFPDGKQVEGRFGDQMYYSLVDGRGMYLDMDVASKINLLEPRAREPFCICKRVLRRNGKRHIEWDVFRPQGGAGPAPAAQATGIGETELERDLRLSIPPEKVNGATVRPAAPTEATAVTQPPMSNGNGNSNRQPSANGNGERSKTKLEDALKTVIAAVYGAQEYAKEIGYAAMPQFTSEDIRTMANTLIIDSQRNGGCR
jgi:hypothetical protein